VNNVHQFAVGWRFWHRTYGAPSMRLCLKLLTGKPRAPCPPGGVAHACHVQEGGGGAGVPTVFLMCEC